MPAFICGAVVFLIAVVLLVTHAQTELSVAFIGVIIAILTLLVTLATSGLKSVKSIIKGVDYKTLLFFVGLFISVGGLEQTGVLDLIAKFITNVSGGSLKIIVVIILWLSAIASAFVDNIPFAATMVPVIRTIATTQGVDLSVLAWTLSLGTDLGGNGTLSAPPQTSSARRRRPSRAIPLAGASTASIVFRQQFSWSVFACSACL